MTRAQVGRALEVLERRGLLLLQDPALPSLVGLIAGGRVQGSWWSHPKGGAIFRTASELEQHPDVATTKLVSGKVTFVHRRLWPLIVAVGRAREEWQLRGLSEASRALLKRVDAESSVSASGAAAKDLEARLLVSSREIHTPSGAHALELVTWQGFARQRGVRASRLSAERARAQLQELVDALNAELGGRGKLPWPKTKPAAERKRGSAAGRASSED